MAVCVSCLSAHISQKSYVQIAWNFLCLLPVVTAQSFFGDTAICCVVPLFEDDVMFSHDDASGAESDTTLFCQVVWWQHQSDVRWCYIWSNSGGMTSSPGLHGWSRLQALRGVLQMTTTTDNDRRQRALLVWPPYTMCRRASNNGDGNNS